MKRFSKKRKNNPNQRTFDQYPQWLKDRILNAEAAKKDYVADPQDSTRVAYQKFKANQTRKPSNGMTLSEMEKGSQQKAQTRPNPDYSLFLKTGRHIHVPFEVIKNALAREAEKKAKSMFLRLEKLFTQKLKDKKNWVRQILLMLYTT